MTIGWKWTRGGRRATCRCAELAGVSSPKEFHTAFTRYFADVLADNLTATLDGKALTFRVVQRDFQVTDHLRCDYRFEAAWQPDDKTTHTFTICEGNYILDDFSALRLTVRGDGRTP